MIIALSSFASAYKEEVDQSSTTINSYKEVYYLHPWAQSFVPQKSQVSKISFFLKRHGGPPETGDKWNPAAYINFYLRKTDANGDPGEDVISKRIPIPDIPKGGMWVDVSFESLVSLNVGQKYWILLQDNLGEISVGEWIEWDGASSDVYPPGGSWSPQAGHSSNDLSFKVYAAVPFCTTNQDCGSTKNIRFCRLFRDAQHPNPDPFNVYAGSLTPICLTYPDQLNNTCSSLLVDGPVEHCTGENLCDPETAQCKPSALNSFIACMATRSAAQFVPSYLVGSAGEMVDIDTSALDQADLGLSENIAAGVEVVSVGAASAICPYALIPEPAEPAIAAYCLLSATPALLLTAEECRQEQSQATDIEQLWMSLYADSIRIASSYAGPPASGYFYKLTFNGVPYTCKTEWGGGIIQNPNIVFSKIDVLRRVEDNCVNDNTHKLGINSGGLFLKDVFRSPYSKATEGDSFKRRCKFQSGYSADCSLINTSLPFELGAVKNYENYVVYKNNASSAWVIYGLNYTCGSQSCDAVVDSRMFARPSKAVGTDSGVKQEFENFLVSQNIKYDAIGEIVSNRSAAVLVPPWTSSKGSSVTLPVSGSSFEVSLTGTLYNSLIQATNYSASALENPPNWDSVWGSGSWLPVKAITDENRFLKKLGHTSSYAQWGEPSQRETIAPSISVSSPQENNQYLLGSILLFDFDVTDDSGIDDNAAFVDRIVKTGRKSQVYSGVFSEGNHSFKVAALDNNGNEAIKEINFTLKHVEGDLDVDAKVTVADALIVTGKIGVKRNESAYDAWADLDGNGEITVEDVRLVLQGVE
ncbi:MAG: hypothetical protein V1717_02615 [Candidatus Micrarchaeota archaeon]